MNKGPESKRDRRGLGLISSGLAVTAFGLVSAFRPDIFAGVYNQAYDVFNPEPTVAASSPAATPTTHNTPTPTQVSTKENSPTPTPNKLGNGRGQTPVGFSWQTSNINIITDEIEAAQTIYEAASNPKSLIWTETQPGVCAAEGVTWIGAHSSITKGRALVQPDMMSRLEKTGVGSMIWTTAKDGAKCGYEAGWYESVKKEGEGPGTFSGLIENNPAGRSLVDQEGKPALVFATCDQEGGREDNHSLNNGIVYAELVEVIPPKK